MLEVPAVTTSVFVASKYARLPEVSRILPASPCFRDITCAEIAQTLNDTPDLDDEMRNLVNALAG